MEQSPAPDTLQEFGVTRVSAIKPELALADVSTNVIRIAAAAEQADKDGVDIAVFPELSLTGYTSGDLFFDQLLQRQVTEGLATLCEQTKDTRAVLVVGAPIVSGNSLYNCAAVLQSGSLMGLVPKVHLPNYNEFYEGRYFASGENVDRAVKVGDQTVRMSAQQVFELPVGTLGVEICEDMWVPDAPSIDLAKNGATIIANLSGSNEVIGKNPYRRNLIAMRSGTLACAYVYCSAGVEESVADVLMGGSAVIAVNGGIAAEGKRFQRGATSLLADVDISHLTRDRVEMTTFRNAKQPFDTVQIEQRQPGAHRELLRAPARMPFVPSNPLEYNERCEEIIEIQAQALATRLLSLPESQQKIILGLSGGLDSTLALLVAVHTMKILGKPMTDIHTITMPGPASSERTQDNASLLAEALGTTHSVRPVIDLARTMLKTIGHDGTTQDIPYENSQARAREDLLFNYSNMVGGMVLGTGDLSEIALGWCTFGGDQLSQYHVNCTIPKTLVRHLVQWATEQDFAEGGKSVLIDILDTPISPELTLEKAGEISQSTEDILGPYELHDFFLYYFNRFGDEPTKIAQLADLAFEGVYDKLEVRQTLQTFVRRWFTSQWKRNVSPDGPKVGTVALSPRGDLRMPPEVNFRVWLREIDSEVEALLAA